MKDGDIVELREDIFPDNYPDGVVGFIAFEFKMSEERATKVVNQSGKVLQIVNSGSHAIVGYLNGTQELLPIGTLEKIG